MPESVWRLPNAGTNIAVLADCHGSSDMVFPRLQDADLIVTLGGVDLVILDRLQEIAPVLGVARSDDPDDIRTRRSSLIFEGEGYSLGCIAELAEPLVAEDAFDAVCLRCFQRPVHLLLHGSRSMPPQETTFARHRSVLHPGGVSDWLPDFGPTFMRIKICADGCYGQLVKLG